MIGVRRVKLFAFEAKILGAAGALAYESPRRVCSPDKNCTESALYTYAGQFFIDEEMRSSTYPDFGSICGDLFCGHTCCVPSDEWEGTYDKMKKWANESRIPQWVLDKAAAAGD